MKTTIGMLSLAALAGSALGQCNIYRYGIPDFDQRRSLLPGDGATYCVPTAALNLMGYIANHGHPQAMGHSSSNWASDSEYFFVSQLDFAMGSFMGTSATNGTDLYGAVEGIREYRDIHDVPVIVTGTANTVDWQISPKHIHDCVKAGWLVTMAYGRYQQQTPGGAWTRTGGHQVTVCFVQDACGQTPVIGFKDPWTSDPESLSNQSPFATATWTTIKRVRNFAGSVYYQWGKYGEFDAETQRYIDVIIVLRPMQALTQGPTTDLLITYTNAFLNNDGTPPLQSLTVPGGAPVRFAAFDPRRAGGFIITGPQVNGTAVLWDHDHADNRLTALLDLEAPPGAFLVDRYGDILLTINGEIYKYRYLDGTLTPVDPVSHDQPFDSLAADDATGDLYALAGQNRRLLRFPGGDLNAVPSNGPLEAGIVIGQSPGVAVNPADGRPWICSQGSDRVYQLKWAPTRQEWSANVFVQLPQGTAPTGLQFGDRGEMVFISKGLVQEWVMQATGQWAPSANPVFGGKNARGFLSLSRSRHNFVPALHTGPAWNNIENPDPDTAEVPDCPADFNGDGFVDGIDYDTFNNLFEAGDMNADFNFDGFVDGIDYDEFNNHFEAGC